MNFIQAKYHYNGGNSPRLVVIHDMEYPKAPGTALWCARYFQNPEAGRTPSAHYTVDAEEIVQCVQESDGAWHTPGYLQGQEINRMSIGIEHAGYAKQTREQWLDAYGQAMLDRSAQLVADICKRYNIPAVFLTEDDLRAGNTNGITGHWQCTKATKVGDHWDPGSGFPWDWYIGKVQGYMSGGSLVSAPAPSTLLTLLALGAMVYGGYTLLTGKPIRIPSFGFR